MILALIILYSTYKLIKYYQLHKLLRGLCCHSIIMLSMVSTYFHLHYAWFFHLTTPTPHNFWNYLEACIYGKTCISINVTFVYACLISCDFYCFACEDSDLVSELISNKNMLHWMVSRFITIGNDGTWQYLNGGTSWRRFPAGRFRMWAGSSLNISRWFWKIGDEIR